MTIFCLPYFDSVCILSFLLNNLLNHATKPSDSCNLIGFPASKIQGKAMSKKQTYSLSTEYY